MSANSLTVDGSNYAPLHLSANPELQAVLADLPGYTPHLEQLQQLHAARAAANSVPSFDLQAAVAATLKAAADGKPVPPPAVVTQLQQHEAAHRSSELATQVLNTAHAQLVTQLDATVSTGRLCTALNDRLQDLVTAARAFKHVPSSPAEAIDTDSVDVWRQSRTMAARYALLRTAQQLAWTTDGAARAPLPQPTAVSGDRAFAWVQNADEVYPRLHLPRRSRAGAAEAFSSDEPWPANFHAPETLWWWRDHPAAQPWVPTPSQYAAKCKSFRISAIQAGQRPRAGDVVVHS